MPYMPQSQLAEPLGAAVRNGRIQSPMAESWMPGHATTWVPWGNPLMGLVQVGCFWSQSIDVEPYVQSEAVSTLRLSDAPRLSLWSHSTAVHVGAVDITRWGG